MNEQVAELMRRHGLHKNITEDCQHRMEMLAELIVRECADIASINQHQYNAVGEYVLQHFGVEP